MTTERAAKAWRKARNLSRKAKQQRRQPPLLRSGRGRGIILSFLPRERRRRRVAKWGLSRWARHHHLHLHQLLPDLWFSCALMAAGLFYCLLLLAGYVAAEINSGCCLCFYTILAMTMVLLEAALAADLIFNKHWIQDLPYDRTGELNNLLCFIQDNLDLCKCAGVAIIATQALSLLLAMILRAMVSTRSVDYDSDEDFVVIRRPLLVAQGAPAYLPTTVDSRGFHPDLWSSRMRQKYGLNSSDHTYNTLDPNAPPPQ